jgi:hypothetical protein
MGGIDVNEVEAVRIDAGIALVVKRFPEEARPAIKAFLVRQVYGVRWAFVAARWASTRGRRGAWRSGAAGCWTRRWSGDGWSQRNWRSLSGARRPECERPWRVCRSRREGGVRWMAIMRRGLTSS